MRHVSATAVGGGTAEVLHRMVPYFRELGIDARWDVIRGNSDFYTVAGKFQAALQGQPQHFTDRDWLIYEQTLQQNVEDLDLAADLVAVHDAQPAGLIRYKSENSRWVWDSLLDLSAPRADAWETLRPMLERYDAAVFSCPMFAPSIAMRQILIAPSIDPTNERNRELTLEQIEGVLDRFH